MCIRDRPRGVRSRNQAAWASRQGARSRSRAQFIWARGSLHTNSRRQAKRAVDSTVALECSARSKTPSGVRNLH
eukprot:12686801-Alexandrium_andersonii.AAC.1